MTKTGFKLNPTHSVIHTEIRNKLGGWVYSRNRSGPYHTIWRQHKAMATGPQNQHRLAFKAIAPRWSNNLTDAQRRAWWALADTITRSDQIGQHYTMQGYNLFLCCNLIAYTYAATFLNDAPVSLAVHQPTQVTIATAQASPAALEIAMEGTLSPGEYWALHATDPQNPGFLNPRGKWRPLASGTNPLPYTEDALDAYNAAFLPLAGGKRLFAQLRIANTNNGAISSGIQTDILIT